MFRLANLQLPIEHGRWGMWPLVFPAWCAAYLKLPLEWVMAVLSISSILIPLAASYIIYKIDRSNQLYLLPLFIIVSTGSEWYYLGIAEMVPALCYCSIYIASLIKAENFKSIYFSLSILLLGAAFFTHPGVLPFLVFSAIFISLYRNKWMGIGTLFFIALFAIAKKYLFHNSGYENDILGRIDIANIKGIFNSWTWHYFTGHFFSIFAIPTMAFVAGIILIQKFYPRINLFVILLAAIGAVMSIVFIFTVGDSNLMMEKNFAPVALLLFIPLLSLNSEAWEMRLPVVLFAVLVSAFGIFSHYQSGDFYSKRLKNLDSLIQQYAVEKNLVYDSTLNPEQWRVTWALPYETLLRSAARKDLHKRICTVKSINTKPDSALIYSNNLFYGAPFAYKINTDTMNLNYFKFSKNSSYHLDSIALKH
ncbi:MAG: hypothetical protein IT244_12370 [Bacteroidia bacterium]|nr:hypothetical protein [Bacteroidia bacterium]